MPSANVAEMLAAGLRPEDFEEEVVEVWPENEPALKLMGEMSTQWRVGFSGPTGLDYGVMFKLMERMHLTDQEWNNLFQDMRVAESEALGLMTLKE